MMTMAGCCRQEGEGRTGSHQHRLFSERQLMKKSIVRVGLYKARPAWSRLDVVPFALAYSVLHAMAWKEQEEVPLWLLIVIPIVLVLHALTHLCTHWSISCKARVAYSKVKYVRQATHIRAKPRRNAGAEELVPIERLPQEQQQEAGVTVVAQEHRLPSARFSFQKTPFCFWSPDAQADEYEALVYPTKGTITAFLSTKGYGRPKEVDVATRIWGKNVFDIPLPAFLELFKEHAVAPFFVFQVLCVLLWSLDDLWYYSMMTLVLLVVFESTVCTQRLRSLETLRGMRRPAYNVYAYRNATWQMLSTEALLPGDVVSLGRISTHQDEKAEGRGRVRSGSGSRRAIELQQQEEEGCGLSERLAPCDMLLLRGSCIVNEAMLTGESTPQLKEALEPPRDADQEHVFDLGAGVSGDVDVRSHVVFGGTKILQLADSRDAATQDKGAAGGVPRPPDRGCVALVLRTGFETSQGQLMRTIIFATRQVSAGSGETVVFIAILLVFALAASAYVLQEGLKDEERNRFKLLLHCIMIITSVVPPELPMELSLAVTNSLAALVKSLVFCTEPFRIPLAGKVSVCCFDKTGTLTSDDLVLQGVVYPPTTDKANTEPQGQELSLVEESITPSSEVCGPALWVLAACHSLMKVDGKLVGDPMERAAVEGVHWTVSSSGDIALPHPTPLHHMGLHKGPTPTGASKGPAPSKADLSPIHIQHRFPFTSSLRRMSVLISRSPPGQSDEMAAILTKGAPEAIRSLLATVPPGYDDTYLHHMGRGRRVLALAYRLLDVKKKAESVVAARQWGREEAEANLTLAGFLIVDCPLKRDSKQVITALQASRHRTVMITGDGALTAVEVARQVGIIPSTDEGDRTSTLRLACRRRKGDGEEEEEKEEMVWEPMSAKPRAEEEDDQDIEVLDLSGVAALAQEHSLCVEGEALKDLIRHWQGGDKARGGDAKSSGKVGRHTVRRLSQLCPHVGVFARVAPDQKEVIIDALNAAGETTLMCGDGTNDVGALKRAHVGVSIINCPELEKRADRRSEIYEQRLMASGGGTAEDNSKLAKMLAELKEQERDPTIVQLGDASIASPFTARRTSVDCVLAVIRQGRCTLVTTLQVYKILALNCLVSAYMLSSLYLFGIKQGDLQMTLLGLSVAVLFFFVSRAEPLEVLSAERPPSRIFCAQVCVSVVLQFIVHLTGLLMTMRMVRPHIRLDDPSMVPDGPFHPTLLNTAIFLLTAVMQLNTFTANYRGHPFMQSLRENTALWRLTLLLYGIMAALALEIVPPVNRMLQLAPFPSISLRLAFTALLTIDTVVVLLIDRACLVLFKGG